MYHYVFFDLDGTLTDSKEGILNCLRYALEKMGRPVPPEETLMKFIGPPLQDSFREFCGFTEEEALRGIRLFRERYAPIGKFENAAAPGMPQLCARLKERGFVLALASSKPEEMCVPICEKFGFTPSLTVITGSPPDGDWSKAPEAKRFDAVLSKSTVTSGVGLEENKVSLNLERDFEVLGPVTIEERYEIVDGKVKIGGLGYKDLLNAAIDLYPETDMVIDIITDYENIDYTIDAKGDEGSTFPEGEKTLSFEIASYTGLAIDIK